jgi:putative ABC transport system ATP-binding protein
MACPGDDKMSAAPIAEPVILRAEHLGRSINGKVLVEDANFELKKGELLAVVGPSGSGKTSLLRLLNRLDEPTSGTVFVEGIDYHNLEPRELRRKLGMVTQRPYLFPGTVAENLSFGPAQRSEVLPQQTIEDLLSQVGLKGYSERNVANLSGGEAQRVSVARTLANEPLVLLLDEPTSALDEAAKLEVESSIQGVVREHGLTCVMVTHDLAQAGRLAERALMMESGRIVRSGRVSEVIHA